LPPGISDTPRAGGRDRMVMFDRRDVALRSSTARIVALGDRALAFVSPVEVSSVERVLRHGPDALRGDPAADGLLSLDLRAHRLPVRVERRFPSLGAIVAGIDRVRATASLADKGILLEAEILAAEVSGAERTRRFLEVLRDNVADARLAGILKELSIEQ